MLLCETIQWTMIGFNSVQWPRKQNYSDILEKISGSLCFPWAARAVLFAMSIQTEYRKAGEESRSPILPSFAPLVMRGREACKQACMHAWVRVCRGFQLHVQFCWVIEWVRKTIYDLITVPIVNHEDCRFKYPNRSWDAKVIRGQNGDSPFSLNSCLELLDCVKYQTQNSVSMHACMHGCTSTWAYVGASNATYIFLSPDGIAKLSHRGSNCESWTLLFQVSRLELRWRSRNRSKRRFVFHLKRLCWIYTKLRTFQSRRDTYLFGVRT